MCEEIYAQTTARIQVYRRAAAKRISQSKKSFDRQWLAHTIELPHPKNQRTLNVLSQETITDTWNELAKWLVDSRYEFASHQCLEEVISLVEAMPDELVLDLYAPISE